MIDHTSGTGLEVSRSTNTLEGIATSSRHFQFAMLYVFINDIDDDIIFESVPVGVENGERNPACWISTGTPPCSLFPARTFPPPLLPPMFRLRKTSRRRHSHDFLS